MLNKQLTILFLFCLCSFLLSFTRYFNVDRVREGEVRGESLVWDGSQLLVVRKNQPVDQENEKTIPASLCPVLKKPFPLNGADVELLKTIPGIGEVMAQRIVDKRTQLGKITSIAQLKSIRGVGEKTAALIAKHTTFDL